MSVDRSLARDRHRLSSTFVVALTLIGVVVPLGQAHGATAFVDRIVVSSNAPGSNGYDIWSMNPDGSDPFRVTSQAGDEMYPTWSPDGTRVAYAADDGAIQIINADGSGSPQTVMSTYYAGELEWSPDGTRIAFSAFASATGSYDVMVVNVDGTGITNLTASTGQQEGDPAWSPDGATLAFDVADNIWLLDMTAPSAAPVQLTATSGSKTGLTWLPDGSLVTFHDASTGRVTKVTPAGTSSTYNFGVGAFGMSWNHDGTRLVWAHNAIELYVTQVGGSSAAITSTGGTYLNAEWIGGTPPAPLPVVSISDVTVTETDVDFFAQLTFTLSEPSDGSVKVTFGTVDGTATSGADYVANPGTITFSAGSTTQTTGIRIVGDNLNEPTETFQVVLSNPVNATIGNGTATWTIHDDDASSVNVTAGDTVSTGSEATTAEPVQTSVTSPVAGGVSIATTAVSQPVPTGFAFFGQQVTIHAPTATAAEPLVLTFVVDGSLLGGVQPADVQVFRNGVFVADCDASSGSAASPDPCVASRVVVSTDGDVQIVVRTSRASDWNFGTVTTTGPSELSLTCPTAPVAVGSAVVVSGTFADPETDDTHSGSVAWGDGTTTSAVVTGHTVTASRSYPEAGVHLIRVTVTDGGGATVSASCEGYVVVYDPNAGFVTGGGWIDSPAGAYAPAPSSAGKAAFGFVSRYKKGASVPVGATELQFQAAGMEFASTSYEWLVISGSRAQYKGRGTINGEGDYGFLLTANDGQLSGGGGADRLRVKIWDRATGADVYDTQMGQEDTAGATTVLGGGSIVIHKK